MSRATDRLARSRQAILAELEPPARRPGRGTPGGWWSRLGVASGTWWRGHPLRMGMEMASPFLTAYAARSPWTLLAVAAAAGAAIAVFRPWRLLSLSLLIAVAKTARLPTLLFSAFTAMDAPDERRRRTDA